MNHPQNPYISCIVKASAGSGKTYQLSRRFLNLVGAGASPDAILAITFTKKAAAEMRERIIHDAAQLLSNQSARQEYNDGIGEFYKTEPKDQVCPPLTPEDVAHTILARTQSLQITTIDSIFLDWVNKFKEEAKFDPTFAFPPNYDIPSASKSTELDGLAWEFACAKIFDSQHIPEGMTPDEAYNRLLELRKSSSFFWLCQQVLGTSIHEYSISENDLLLTEATVMDQLTSPLKTIAGETKRAADFLAAVESGRIETLIQSKLLTKSLSVSGQIIRGKKRELLSSEILEVESTLNRYFNKTKVTKLNNIAKWLSKAFTIFETERQRLKSSQDIVEFEDLSKGCFSLFAKEDAIGARFLIQQKTHHLLLDEFQDTSRLQWSIFKSIADEILSGSGLDYNSTLRPTVFIVGDPKQSIYGFREADADILDEASDYLEAKGVVPIQLNQSYRTSQIVLDLVNEVFADRIPRFPKHETATLDEKPFIPNLGSLQLSPLFEGTDAIEDEANFIAQTLKKFLIEQPLMIPNGKSVRRLKPEDCAILYRSTTHVNAFTAALRAEGLDYRREESQGFFDRQEIRDFINLLKFLNEPNDLLSFSAMLASPLSPLRNSNFFAYLQGEQKKQDEKVLPLSIISSFLKTHTTNSGFCDKLLRYLSKSQKAQAPKLIIDLIKEFKVFQRYSAAFPENEIPICEANIQSFIEMIYSLQNSGHFSLHSILMKLEDMALEDETPVASAGQNAISLMTIHKSKGLEYPLVVLVGLGEAWERSDPYWIKVQSGAEPGFYYSDTKQSQPIDHPFFDQLVQEAANQDERENLRLLYVALTRAKHHLILSASRKLGSRKKAGYYEHIGQSLCHISGKDHDPSTILSYHERGTATPPETKEPNHQPRIPEPFAYPILRQQNHFQQVKTLAPAKLLEDDDRSQHKLSIGPNPYGTIAKELGIYIHKLLELLAIDETHNPSDYWESIVGSAPAKYQPQLGLAEEQISSILNSPFWQDVKSSEKLWVEKDIVYHDGKQLIRGTMDLVFWKSPKEIWLVDYKSTYIPPNTSAEDVAHDRVYRNLLSAYRVALENLFPGSRVEGAVLFTSINRLVKLSSSLAN